MRLIELSNEQTRQLIDVSHVFMARRGARKHSVGHYRWVTKRGLEYLMWDYQGRERSLGRRSPETDAMMERHKRARETYKTTGARLREMARVNKALRLNRVPLTTAKLLRALDDAELLGPTFS